METETPTEQAARLIAALPSPNNYVTFYDNKPPTVRNMYADEQPGDEVTATSAEHLVELLRAAHGSYERKIQQWIAESYSRT